MDQKDIKKSAKFLVSALAGKSNENTGEPKILS